MIRKSLFQLFLILGSFSLMASPNGVKEKELQTSLRLVGHELLLRVGDDSSRVMPIQKDGNTYRLTFENEFALDPEMVILIVDSVMNLREYVESYVVEIAQCETNEIVHSYSMNVVEDSDLLACKGRGLPKDCYSILFTLDRTSETMAMAEKAASDSNDSNSSIIYVIMMAGLLIGIIGYLAYRNKKRSDARFKHLVSLGNYYFDHRNAELIHEEDKTELSNKEADLLNLLYTSLNNTLERDFILNKVWGDEGDYVGRTLDVFISKLRKKLEADPSIKIVNVRGVGYKMVLG